VADLSKYIDHGKKEVRSVTGQLALDYGRGVCRLDAPKAQGVCGFLADAGPSDLGAVRVESKNAYAAVLAVSLDGKDLKDAGSVLVQVTTQCRPYGWKEAEATFQDNEKKHTFKGKRIDDTGAPPWNVRDTDVTVTVRNPGLRKATLLDANGYPAGAVEVKAAGGALRVTLPKNALYVVLE
jgi:hypothetical protein